MYYYSFNRHHSNFIPYIGSQLLVEEGDNFVPDTPFCNGKIPIADFAKFLVSSRSRNFIFNCIFNMLLKGHKVPSFLY